MTIKKFNPNKRPRGKTKQAGSQNSYTALSRNIEKKLELYETVATYDATISSTLDLLVECLVSSLGEIEHEYEEAQEFCREQKKYLQDEYNIDIYQEIKQIVKSTLRSGFSATETLFEDRGFLSLRGFAQYHPSTIVIRTNKRGQLTEGEPSPDPGFTSGIWQRVRNPQLINNQNGNNGEILLDMWRTTLLTHNKTYNNYYGTSVIESAYRWHVIKESLLDMFLVTQDQHGNPMTVMYIPNTNSGEYELDPETGEEKPLTVMNSIERQLNSTSSQEGNTLLFPYTDKDMKPEVKVLSNSGDVAAGYIDAVKFCDQQIIRSMLVPLSLVDSSEVSSGEMAERDMEMFNRTIESLYKTLVVPIINKSFGFLIKENFSPPVSKSMPTIPLRNIMRPEDRVSMMQFIRGLTELTYLNPSNEVDREMVRSWVGAIDREWSSEDAEFFKKFLLQEIDESKKQSGGEGKAPSRNATPTNRGSNSPTRNRKGEGKKQKKPGRPVGKATPNVRDKNKKAKA